MATQTITRLEQLRALREAGHVERCHTLAHHGSYSVAAHSWQALVLLRELHPRPSPELVWAVALHDVAERYLGDLPSPTKASSEGLAGAYELAEERTLQAMGVDLEINQEEFRWLQAIDKLELYLWCQDQQALGNQHVQNAVKFLTRWFNDNRAQIPEQVTHFLDSFKWSRTDRGLFARGLE